MAFPVLTGTLEKVSRCSFSHFSKRSTPSAVLCMNMLKERVHWSCSWFWWTGHQFAANEHEHEGCQLPPELTKLMLCVLQRPPCQHASATGNWDAAINIERRFMNQPGQIPAETVSRFYANRVRHLKKQVLTILKRHVESKRPTSEWW